MALHPHSLGPSHASTAWNLADFHGQHHYHQQKALCHAPKAQRLTFQKFARWENNPWVIMKWLSSYELFSYPEDKMNLSHITLVNYQEVHLWTCLKPVATILVPQLILTHRWFWFGLQTFSNSLVEPIFNHWEISRIASHFSLLLKDQMTRIPSQLLWGHHIRSCPESYSSHCMASRTSKPTVTNQEARTEAAVRPKES